MSKWSVHCRGRNHRLTFTEKPLLCSHIKTHSLFCSCSPLGAAVGGERDQRVEGTVVQKVPLPHRL